LLDYCYSLVLRRIAGSDGSPLQYQATVSARQKLRDWFELLHASIDVRSKV
jgi:hypothetical protein